MGSLKAGMASLTVSAFENEALLLVERFFSSQGQVALWVFSLLLHLL